jgi:hypothetical protein
VRLPTLPTPWTCGQIARRSLSGQTSGVFECLSFATYRPGIKLADTSAVRRNNLNAKTAAEKAQRTTGWG